MANQSMYKRNFQTGLSMAEIMAVLVLVAILGSMAVPRVNKIQAQTTDIDPAHSVDTVKSAHATAIADLKRFPSVAELTRYVDPSGADAVASGIQIAIRGSRYTVPTFSDAACKKHTSNTSDQVACIGNL